MNHRFMTIWKAVLIGVRVLLFFLAPLFMILFLVGVIMSLDSYGAYRSFVQRMRDEGQTATAVIDIVSREKNWIFVDYFDAQDDLRHGVLEMHYYDPALWERFTLNTTVQIRYLPFSARGSDRVVLEEHFDDVLAYRGTLVRGFVGILLGSWIVIVLEPRWLYFGLVDHEELFKEKGVEGLFYKGIGEFFKGREEQ